jgi:hypothetical protein
LVNGELQAYRRRRGIAPLNLNLGYISSHTLAHYKPLVEDAGCPSCTDGGEKQNMTIRKKILPLAN